MEQYQRRNCGRGYFACKSANIFQFIGFRSFRLMEKTESLKQIDGQLCWYFQKYNNSKKDEIFCYQPDKKKISEFYSTMNDQFYQRKIKKNLDSSRNRHRSSKIKAKLTKNIHNPINSCLPKSISQQNVIKVQHQERTRPKLAPMFSEVECSKKNNYVMGEEVRQVVTQQIREMIRKKEQEQFRKNFPLKASKCKSEIAVSNIKTEQLIKTYNRILAKYKYGGNMDNNLKIMDLNSCEDQDMALDNQLFNLLGLFKKIYYETKSEFITDNLMKYILKFKKEDKFQRLFRSRKMMSAKSMHKKSHSGISEAASSSKNEAPLKAASGSVSRHSKKVSILSQTQGGKNRLSLTQKENSSMQIRGTISRFSILPGEKVRKTKLRL